ncbi:hypothetical protein RV11_GL001412 [Enterococcus phoeniculicola]|uniref:Mga helix-turn-helix domain-containing protein n=1 Tax=Enterococcus phoeniculicola ATCC BAA-412 TaxID=1158610 RepID=R3TL98_9ENTE|nr:helix-turn-helix domain-containing protein [Enterococcus phoeniculicola]EOL41813.1 hypothetical protein UC3_03378 [Enterococcus phoeniculicola ATCC BAA-412]EOT78693.1 hypothetical protein I589_00198 [Enterococcus phoeniculicola ATCC BAA-412]OJG70410.1 hypothetical protein RV11_GL001412 [Enterococcus phoeniculicola]
MEVFNEFLGRQAEKELQLLKLLYLEAPTFLSVKELSMELQIDRRTVYKYYNALTKIPYLNQEKKGEILVQKHNLGYTFKGTKADYKLIKQQLIQSNPFYEMLVTLFFYNEVNITKFSIENFVSESSIRDRLVKLETALATFHLSIQKKDKVIYLNGDEKRIRYVMVLFFWRIYNGLDWPFQGIVQGKTKSIISTLAEVTDYKITKVNNELLSYILAVNVIRNQKFFLVDNNFIEKTALSRHILNANQELKRTTEKILKKNYFFNSNESDFVLLWLSMVANFHSNSNNLTKEYAHYICENIVSSSNSEWYKRRVTELTEREQTAFWEVLVYGHMCTELFKDIGFTITGYDVKSYLEDTYPAYFPKVRAILSQFTLGMYTEEERESLLYYYTLAYSLIEEVSFFSNLIKVKLETDLPQVLEIGVKKRIEKTFENFYNLDVDTTNKYDSYDLCISTSPLSILDKDYASLLINAQVTLNDFVKINELLKKISDHKK